MRRLAILGAATGLVVTATAGAGPAAADPVDLAAVVVRIDDGHARAVIDELRPRLAELDATGRCALGMAYAGAVTQGGRHPAPSSGDRTRALLYLASCDSDLPTAIATRAGSAADRLAAQADRARDSKVELIAAATISVEVEAPGAPLAGDLALAPSTFYLPAGDYVLTAHLPDGSRLLQPLALARGAPARVLFELPKPVAPSTEPTSIDFEGAEPEATYVGPPPKQKHGSLIGGKFGKGLEANRVARAEAAAGIEAIPDDDPAVRSDRRPLPWRSKWRGLRLGVGMAGAAGDPPLQALVGTGIRRALAPRLALDGGLELIVRSVDRPGPAMSPTVVTGGLGVALRWWAWTARDTAVSVAGGGRADLDRIEGGDTGLGATATAGAAIHLYDRFTFELRGELGATELEGTRPRAIVLELAVD